MTQIQQLMNEYFLASIAKDFSLCAEIESKILFNYGTMRKALHDIVYIPNAMYGGDWDEIEKARNIATGALVDCKEV